METLRDARGIVFLTNTEYWPDGRLKTQTQPNGAPPWGFVYTVDENNKVTQVDVTNPRGYHRVVTFNADGYPLTDTRAVGQPEQRQVTFDPAPGTNLVRSMTEPLPASTRTTTYTYDPQGMGNVELITQQAGTLTAITRLTYEPAFNQVQAITDPNNHTTTLGYDAQGRLTSITDSLQNAWTIGPNAQGRPVTITDPRNKTWTLGYGPLGDLETITDPLGNVTTRYSDGAGRLVLLTDPLGARTRYTWDALNRLTQIQDALGGLTTFGYDPNGNLTEVRDARQQPQGPATVYTYNTMDWLSTRTDPLGHPESYSLYDGNGNLKVFTDRKGQTRELEYDPLDRIKAVTWKDPNGQPVATTRYTWDVGNRLTQIDDTVSGIITRDYDGLDRLVLETTPQGTVTYPLYDTGGRRKQMMVAGQPLVSYEYYDDDRLWTVSQGGSTVTLTYDTVGRRQRLTLPNNVRALYDYDNASRPTGMTFKKGSTTLGDLTYTYDAAGRRTSVGGTWVRTGIPQAVGGTEYNANNQQLRWNVTPRVSPSGP